MNKPKTVILPSIPNGRKHSPVALATFPVLLVDQWENAGRPGSYLDNKDYFDNFNTLPITGVGPVLVELTSAGGRVVDDELSTFVVAIDVP